MKIHDKLRKLLALAENNPSPEEAAAAFARAQELATKHRIELASVDVSDPDADEMINEVISVSSGTRVMGWKKRLAWGLDSLGVYPLVQSGNGTVSFAGKRGDVDTAAYMYRAICAEIERLARDLAYGRGRAYVNAFKLGAASMVAKRLREMHESTIDAARTSGVSETALARVEDARDLAKSWYCDDQGNRVSTGRAASYSSREGCSAGREAGRSINLGGNREIGRGNLALGAGS